MPLSNFNLTIEDGIILHLTEYSKCQDEFEVPFDITQPGIAEALVIRRSHVSYVMKGLKIKGFVHERIAHVKSIVRKRKVYSLTPEGMDYARKIRSNIDEKSIHIQESSGKTKTLKISEINKHLSTKIPVLQLINLSAPDGTIESASIEHYKSTAKNVRLFRTDEHQIVKFIDNMTQPLRFIGRTIERELIKSWIASDRPRLIVIKGIPGIGKTTLASKIIENYTQEQERGIFWYKLHEWDTLRGILTDLAEFLAQSGKQKLKFYLERESTIELPELRKILEADLEELNTVMVFDDFQKVGHSLKHLFSMFVELLDSEKLNSVNILLLTRGATGFYDRREVAINKLVTELELGGLDSEDSKRLLNLKDIKDSEFNKIYTITEGHPLTIELISIHIAEQAMKNKANKLGSKLDIGELFKEQHDINKYINEEIFQRLSSAEKKLLGMISVFRYPVHPEALFIDDEIDYETIDHLTGKSLLHETTSGYDIHELIKEFFYRRLTPQLKVQFHKEAANYYSSELELSGSSLNADLPQTSNSVLEAQFHYIRAGRFGDAAKLACKYGDILISKGFTEEFIVILSGLSPEKVSEDTWPELLIHKGQILTMNGEWDSALSCYQDSLAWCEEHKDNCGLARAYNAIGAIHYRKGDMERAMELYHRGLEFADGKGDDHNRSKLISNIALVHWGFGELDKAIDLIKKSLELSEKLEDSRGIARAHNNLGIIYWEQRNLDEAISEYIRSLKLSESLGDKRTIAILFDNLAEAYRLKGDTQKAEEFYQKSLDLSEDLGFKWQIAEVNCNLGILYKDSDNNKSKEHLDTALELYTTLGAKREVKKVKGIMNRK